MSSDIRYRLGGFLLLLVAAAVGWLGVWRPLQEAANGALVVTWPLRAVVLVPLATLFGLFFLTTGDRYPYRDVEKQTLTPVGWVLLGVAGASALAAYFGMSHILASMGYRAGP